ncbi:MAG: hypothetical protein DSY83_14830, partial [Flavobacteriia bacterium]
MEYQTNPSNKVSMDDESLNEDFHVRKFSVFVAENSLGRLTVGQHSAATDGIAEIDLSGTSLAGTSARMSEKSSTLSMIPSMVLRSIRLAE